MFQFSAKCKSAAIFQFRKDQPMKWRLVFFVEFNLFIILMRVKCILPHCTKFQPKQLIRHKFLKDEFSKTSHRCLCVKYCGGYFASHAWEICVCWHGQWWYETWFAFVELLGQVIHVITQIYQVLEFTTYGCSALFTPNFVQQMKTIIGPNFDMNL